jgi:hypothetical protein
VQHRPRRPARWDDLQAGEIIVRGKGNRAGSGPEVASLADLVGARVKTSTQTVVTPRRLDTTTSARPSITQVTLLQLPFIAISSASDVLSSYDP